MSLPSSGGEDGLAEAFEQLGNPRQASRLAATIPNSPSNTPTIRPAPPTGHEYRYFREVFWLIETVIDGMSDALAHILSKGLRLHEHICEPWLNILMARRSE